jgi:hypothetical protein
MAFYNLTNTTFYFNASEMGIVQNWSNMSSPNEYLYPMLWWETSLGSMFWLLLFFSMVSIVFVKTKSMVTTSVVVIFLSSLMILRLPDTAQMIAYFALVMGVFGVLYKILVGRG